MGLEAPPKYCSCELESQSQYSPGIVSDEESVARLIFSPLHIKDGVILSAAFSDVDVDGRGLSVNRLDYCGEDFLKDAGAKKAAEDRQRTGKGRDYEGYIMASVCPVRCILHEGKRAFCVKDTALPENISHADIEKDSAYSNLTPSERRRLRRKLQQQFTLVCC